MASEHSSLSPLVTQWKGPAGVLPGLSETWTGFMLPEMLPNEIISAAVQGRDPAF